jgi:hypothetical protein
VRHSLRSNEWVADRVVLQLHQRRERETPNVTPPEKVSHPLCLSVRWIDLSSVFPIHFHRFTRLPTRAFLPILCPG